MAIRSNDMNDEKVRCCNMNYREAEFHILVNDGCRAAVTSMTHMTKSPDRKKHCQGQLTRPSEGEYRK